VEAADDALTAQWIPLVELTNLAFDHGAILCEALGALWPNMPTFKLDVKLPYIFGPKNTHPPFLFYGGSFDPWHKGHLECVAQASKSDGRAVTIIPDRNPFKKIQQGDCFWKRYVELARQFSHLEHALFPGFYGKEQKNPTANWIVDVESPSFIIGDDNLSVIEQWINYQQFLSHLDKLYVVPRHNSLEQSQKMITQLKQQFSSCNFILLQQHEYQHLSSSALRS
jgi:nicotinate-nucleotide adenylyltransferase